MIMHGPTNIKCHLLVYCMGGGAREDEKTVFRLIGWDLMDSKLAVREFFRVKEIFPISS